MDYKLLIVMDTEMLLGEENPIRFLWDNPSVRGAFGSVYRTTNLRDIVERVRVSPKNVIVAVGPEFFTRKDAVEFVLLEAGLPRRNIVFFQKTLDGVSCEHLGQSKSASDIAQIVVSAAG